MIFRYNYNEGDIMSYNIIDIINKKRLKQKLNREELYFAFDGYLKGKIPDYQMS